MSSPLTSRTGRAAQPLRLLGVLVMVLALCVGTASADTAPPAPDGPGSVVALLKWCWTHRDAQRYRDLFTADYQFVPGAPDLPWNRDDELAMVSSLFGSGTATQPGAVSVSLDFIGDPQPGTASLPGEPYPAYQQFLASVVLVIGRRDNSSLTGSGATFLHLVRGDLAAIPQEMRDRGIGPDPSRWYVQRWEDVPPAGLVLDHAPVVTAPESVTVRAGSVLMLDITVTDIDDEAITSLVSAGVSEGNFVRGTDNLSGRLSWTPGKADIGAHWVTFTASNRLTGSATTRIVVDEGAPPIAVLTASPTSGNAPLQVALDASGSSDPDGRIIAYRFDFGDGSNVLPSPTPRVTHTFLQEGKFTPSVTVTDNDGLSIRGNGPSLDINAPPIARFTIDASHGVAPMIVAFNTTSSGDPDGTIVNYVMAFGDGSSDTRTSGATFTHTYGAGVFDPTLTVTDNRGATGSMSVTISVTGDHAPFVDVTDPISVKVGKTMLFTVTTGDPDGQPITSLMASGLPTGATFTLASSHQSGTFAWTPAIADTGRYLVTFTVSNTLTSSRTITLYVNPPNRPPVGSLAVNPATSIEPAMVRLNASASRDGDGRIVSYRFDFGDGTSFTQATPEIDHVYSAGYWRAQVTVTDDDGAQGVGGADVQVAPIGSVPNLARNPSFEFDTRYWNSYAGSLLERVTGAGHDGNFGLQISGPPVINGSFGINDSPDMVRWTLGPGLRYRYTAWVRSVSSHGLAKLRVTEYLIAGGIKLGMATSNPVALSPDWQQLTVEYTTTSANSTLDFQVRDFPIVPSEVFITDDIAIRNVTAVGAGTGMATWYQGDDLVAMDARLVPMPMHGNGTLSFMTSQSGALRVEILDLAGRRVRRVMDDREAPAGLYEFPITRAGDDGSHLGAGVYFWRIDSREGVDVQHFGDIQSGLVGVHGPRGLSPEIAIVGAVLPRGAKLRHLTVMTQRKQSMVRIVVSDTGHGMQPAVAQRVFEPFFTTKAPGQGTGLGLSVSYGIIQAHSGAITVESTPEIGTTFTILLPLYSETKK